MNVNDKIALEIGRAILAKIVAEAQRDEAIAERDEALSRLSLTEPEGLGLKGFQHDK